MIWFYFCKGVAVGCGWQAFVAYVNIGCYYVVGVPLGALLGFYFKFGAKVLLFNQILFCRVHQFLLQFILTISLNKP